MYNADFGDGRLSDLEITDGAVSNLNGYIRVTKISGNVIEVDAGTLIESEYAPFKAGEKVLIHVTATNGLTTDDLGRYLIADIILVNGNLLTLDRAVFDCDLNYYYVQAISIPQFDCLKLRNATLTPPPFNPFKFVGGILVFSCYNDFVMENSAIDLTECGIPANRKTLRPLTEQEYHELDAATRAGEENAITAERFLINCGDGGCMIFARNFMADEFSRIGNPKTLGRALCRGAADSEFKPSDVTNVGGSTILIGAREVLGTRDNALTPNPYSLTPILAKYRSSNLPQGRGLARCYIASNSTLPNDEKLYSYDILFDEMRVRNLGVENFGNGELGNAINPKLPNNTAQVDARAGCQFFYNSKTLKGLAAIKQGSLVLLQSNAGDICLAKVLTDNGQSLITDKEFDAAQIISIAQFNNLTINEKMAVGNIYSVAVANTLDLSGAVIDAGAGSNFGNAQSWNKLNSPGTFILAKKIIMNEYTKITGNALIIADDIENLEVAQISGGDCFIYKN